MDLLKTLCSVPTAPFAEGAVARFVREFVAQRPRLSLRADRFGNLLIELGKARAGKSPRWVFTAHMDHPGFVAAAMRDGTTLRARFHGWVKVEYVRHAAVRFFNGRGQVRGKIIAATVEDYDKRAVPHEVLVRVDRPVAPGSAGMFDLGVGRYAGGKFRCRCCDDLAGAAACLEMLEQLCKDPGQLRVGLAVLLTRAEEEGFIGAIAASEHRTLLRKSDRVIAIECSAVQPYAPQGGGVILRVGDRTSVFNSALTYFMAQQAEQLQQKDPAFGFQRALMSGGTCEATVYDAWGYTAASLCVPLGNYHNMDTRKQKLAAEFIDVSDWQNMVKLFVQLARKGHEFEPGHAELKKRVLQRYRKLSGLLQKGD